MQFTPGPNGLTNGVIHGALKQSDVDGVLIPALASNLTQLVKASPCLADCMAAKSFDTSPADGTVSATEVKGNLTQALTADIDLYDSSGKWAPSAANANPDSMTIGIGFTAKKATFSE
jgi:hypothetical protein